MSEACPVAWVVSQRRLAGRGRWLRMAAWGGLAAIALLVGCAKESVHSSLESKDATAQAIAEELRLDVGIQLFDANIPDDETTHEKRFIYPEIRNAESRYLPMQLANTLQGSGNWGVVSVMPENSAARDINVSGVIVESTGYRLALDIDVVDSSGKRWFSKVYRQQPSKYAYHNKRRENVDPFQETYVDIANDMLKHAQRKLKPKDAQRLRSITQLRYAGDLVPEAYGDYLKERRSGHFKIAQLPSADDPIMQRVEAVRLRENLLVDTLQDHYGVFSESIGLPYQRWRSETYRELVALEAQRKRSRAAILAGIAAVVVGATIADNNPDSTIAEVASSGATIGGVLGVIHGVSGGAQIGVHKDAVREISESLNSEIVDNVISLEESTIVLRGNAEQQFGQWRDLLRDLHLTDTAAQPSS